jgi:hypothetical protein
MTEETLEALRRSGTGGSKRDAINSRTYEVEIDVQAEVGLECVVYKRLYGFRLRGRTSAIARKLIETLHEGKGDSLYGRLRTASRHVYKVDRKGIPGTN